MQIHENVHVQNAPQKKDTSSSHKTQIPSPPGSSTFVSGIDSSFLETKLQLEMSLASSQRLKKETKSKVFLYKTDFAWQKVNMKRCAAK